MGCRMEVELGGKKQVVTLPSADVRVSVEGWAGALSSNKRILYSMLLT